MIEVIESVLVRNGSVETVVGVEAIVKELRLDVTYHAVVVVRGGNLYETTIDSARAGDANAIDRRSTTTRSRSKHDHKYTDYPDPAPAVRPWSSGRYTYNLIHLRGRW